MSGLHCCTLAGYLWAVPRYSIHRHRPRSARSLTAAAQRVTDPAKTFKSSPMSSGKGDWQEEAWRYLELVGELAYYASWRSSSASRVRFVASEIGPDGKPTGNVEDENPEAERVRQIVNDIGGGPAGQSQLLKRGVYLMTIPGEYWAAMIVRDPTREEEPDGSAVALTPAALRNPAAAALEQWYVFNRDEIKTKGEDIVLTLPDGTKHTFNTDTDIMFRVWEPHPKNATLPVSAVWSNRVILNEIVRSTATIDNAAKSRLVGNGLMFIPQEMSLPNQVAPKALPDGQTDTNNPEPDWEPSTSQELQDLIYEVASTAIKDPDSLAALLPIIASGPGEWIKNIQWLRPSSDIPETALKTRNEAIRRLAMGLDVAPERLLGLGENSNHWTAWLVDENDVRVHIAPPVETICAAYTQEVLRPALVAEGIEPDKYLIWHDDTDLTQDPDKKDEARDAHDRGALSSAALRAHLGFDDADGYDLTTKEGWAELAMDKAAKDPNLIPLLAPLLGALVADVQAPAAPQGELPAAPSDEPPADEPAPEAEPEEPTSTPEANSTNAAAVTIARLCVNRALELANKRRRTRSNSDLFRDVPIELAHTKLPPAKYDDVDKLIEGWSAGLSDTDLNRIGLDCNAFRAMVRGVVTVSLVTGTQPVLTASMLRRH